jgi:hypothetical protein
MSGHYSKPYEQILFNTEQLQKSSKQPYEQVLFNTNQFQKSSKQPYEQILFNTNQFQKSSKQPYEQILFSSNTNQSQNSAPPVQPKPKQEVPPPLSEESKMDLYSKVNKRRSPPVNKNNQESPKPVHNNDTTKIVQEVGKSVNNVDQEAPRTSNIKTKQIDHEDSSTLAAAQSSTSSSSGSPPPLEVIAPSRRIR